MPGRLAAIALLFASPACAAGPTFVLTIKDHKISPPEMTLPAGRKITILLINKDSAMEEFDSQVNKMDEDVPPHGHLSFELGPLKPGYYEFLGEFHPKTAKGHFRVSPQD